MNKNYDALFGDGPSKSDYLKKRRSIPILERIAGWRQRIAYLIDNLRDGGYLGTSRYKIRIAAPSLRETLREAFRRNRVKV